MTGRNSQDGVPSIQFTCPACEKEYHLPGGAPAAAECGHESCPGCGFKFETSLKDFNGERPVEKCAICGTQEFFIQKDFNRQLGILIAICSLMIVFLLMVFVHHLVGLYCLFALAFVDFLIYWRFGNVTVCYLCTTIYRGFNQGDHHKGFYLGSEEKYKHLRRDWINEIAALEAPEVESTGKTEVSGLDK